MTNILFFPQFQVFVFSNNVETVEFHVLRLKALNIKATSDFHKKNNFLPFVFFGC